MSDCHIDMMFFFTPPHEIEVVNEVCCFAICGIATIFRYLGLTERRDSGSILLGDGWIEGWFCPTGDTELHGK